LSNFESTVDPKAISSVLKNHKKSKKRYSENRLTIRKQKGYTSTHEKLRNNAPKLLSSKFNKFNKPELMH
jgi:hypothetical protein